jgi:hypothetical protein
LGVTDAFNVAELDVSNVGAVVVTDGAAGGVVNDCTSPVAVPNWLVARAQKKIVVAGGSAATVVEYATALLPAPSVAPPVEGARAPNVSLHVPGFVVEKRKNPVVAPPLGVAVPFNVAVDADTAVAAVVVADGSVGVLKVDTAPTPRPSAFSAMAQKK